jgi:hypothetical protein
MSTLVDAVALFTMLVTTVFVFLPQVVKLVFLYQSRGRCPQRPPPRDHPMKHRE